MHTDLDNVFTGSSQTDTIPVAGGPIGIQINALPAFHNPPRIRIIATHTQPPVQILMRRDLLVRHALIQRFRIRDQIP